jgi:demethylmenaquinone methyltransferase/2-methoxy-6-polyprenyl-1,4-benzoquinol methylase
MARDDSPTDFGFETVTAAEKTRRVGEVFRSVARRYDVMNDLMSLGSHRLMKRMTVEMSGLRSGNRVLDLAGGTGDLAALYAPIVGPTGQVVLADINAAMMQVGRDRMLDRGLTQVEFCQCDAAALPFADASFDCVTIGFGLRNVTHKERALAEMYRVLCPGGRLLVLEFSKPDNAFVAAAYGVFQTLWPTIGGAVTGDAAAYKYLVESIEVHPSQKALKLMIADAGFSGVGYENLLNGIVAIHHADKAS